MNTENSHVVNLDTAEDPDVIPSLHLGPVVILRNDHFYSPKLIAYCPAQSRLKMIMQHISARAFARGIERRVTISRRATYFVPLLPRWGQRYFLTDDDRALSSCTPPTTVVSKDDFEYTRLHLKRMVRRMNANGTYHIPDADLSYFLGGAACRVGIWAGITYVLAADVAFLPVWCSLMATLMNTSREHGSQLTDARHEVRQLLQK